MPNLIISLVLASLLMPAGFDFFFQRSVDHSFIGKLNENALAPQRIVNKSFGLKTTSDNILVIDDNSQLVLYDKASSEIVPIASITKLMTALVFLDTSPSWEEVVTIEREDQRPGGQVYLLTGEQVTVEDLFYLALGASSNEAAVALARVSGIENFPAAMNKKASDLGMSNTFFVDPSGLDIENVSTARDLVKLADAAFSRDEITSAVTKSNYNFFVENNGRRGSSRNTNRLLSSFLNSGEYKIIGAKTGFLNEAGYCFLVKVQKNNGPILTLVFLGADETTDRWQETKGVVDWIFDNYTFPSSN